MSYYKRMLIRRCRSRSVLSIANILFDLIIPPPPEKLYTDMEGEGKGMFKEWKKKGCLFHKVYPQFYFYIHYDYANECVY